MPNCRAALLALSWLLMAAAASAETLTGFVDAPGGRKLWYEVKGQGSPIVFLHDGLMSQPFRGNALSAPASPR